MVIDPIGAGGAAAKNDPANERLSVPVVETIPPVEGARNHPGTQLDTRSGQRDSRGRQLAGDNLTALRGSTTDVRDALDKAQRELNEMLLKVNQRLSFRVHEGSERMSVQVIDNQTNEVVREVPPEEFLDTIAKVKEFIGLLFDDWV